MLAPRRVSSPSSEPMHSATQPGSGTTARRTADVADVPMSQQALLGRHLARHGKLLHNGKVEDEKVCKDAMTSSTAVPEAGHGSHSAPTQHLPASGTPRDAARAPPYEAGATACSGAGGRQRPAATVSASQTPNGTARRLRHYRSGRVKPRCRRCVNKVTKVFMRLPHFRQATWQATLQPALTQITAPTAHGDSPSRITSFPSDCRPPGVRTGELLPHH